jgi:hypothetical protein
LTADRTEFHRMGTRRGQWEFITGTDGGDGVRSGAGMGFG